VNALNLYPVFLDLAGREALVVGGGPVATRKAASLAKAGARVTVVAPQIGTELEQMGRENMARLFRRNFEPEDLEKKWLVIAATDDPQINRDVAKAAARKRIFCNVVDRPQICSFQVPAVLERGMLKIAVSTSGASPAMARRIRKELEARYGPVYRELMEGLLNLRKHFQKKYPKDQARRRRLLESFLDSPAAELLLTGGDSKAFLAEVEQWKSR
jgi:precorrin-2 dehydrogenase/sirohydrochlorin ferrochelatase